MGQANRALVALLATLLIGLGRPPAGTAGDTPEGSDRAEAAPRVTDAECRRFARALEKAVQKGDEAAFSGLIDWDAIIDRSIARDTPGYT